MVFLVVFSVVVEIVVFVVVVEVVVVVIVVVVVVVVVVEVVNVVVVNDLVLAVKVGVEGVVNLTPFAIAFLISANTLIWDLGCSKSAGC